MRKMKRVVMESKARHITSERQHETSWYACPYCGKNVCLDGYVGCHHLVFHVDLRKYRLELIDRHLWDYILDVTPKAVCDYEGAELAQVMILKKQRCNCNEPTKACRMRKERKVQSLLTLVCESFRSIRRLLPSFTLVQHGKCAEHAEARHCVVALVSDEDLKILVGYRGQQRIMPIV